MREEGTVAGSLLNLTLVSDLTMAVQIGMSWDMFVVCLSGCSLQLY